MSAKILWAVVGGVLFGVFTRSFVDFSWPFVAFIFLLSAIALLLTQYDISYWANLLICSIVLAACGLGIVRTDAAKLVGNPNLDAHIGESVTIEGIVVDEPDIRDSGVRLHIEVQDVGLLVVAPPHSEGAYGDIVRVHGQLELPEKFDTTLGRQFDYPMYLAKDGILYTLSFAEVEKIGEASKNPLKSAAIWFKQKYLEGLHLVLPEPESGLAGGITVGDKRGVGKEFSDIFITVGLVHIIVLSGYNITLVINAVGILFSRTPRFTQLLASTLIVAFIVLMAGASAGATRAGAMALLPLIARMTGRLYLAIRALGVVALLMVLWNPFILAFDPGFQLSVLATLGLVLFSPIFAGWLPWIPEKLALREIVASTLGTQTAVLPLLLYQNGMLSIVALPANLLALIVVPWAMALSALSAIAGIIFGSFGTFIAFPAYLLLAYILKIGELFALLPFASVSVPAFNAWWMAVAYALLFGGYIRLKKKFPQV